MENSKKNNIKNSNIYGEFIVSYFMWNDLDKQKNRAEELVNMTKKTNNNLLGIDIK